MCCITKAISLHADSKNLRHYIHCQCSAECAEAHQALTGRETNPKSRCVRVLTAARSPTGCHERPSCGTSPLTRDETTPTLHLEESCRPSLVSRTGSYARSAEMTLRALDHARSCSKRLMVDEIGAIASMQWKNGMDGPRPRSLAACLTAGLTAFLEAAGGHAR